MGIDIEPKRYIELLELEHKTKLDALRENFNEVSVELHELKRVHQKLYKSIATCSCKDYAPALLVYVPEAITGGGGYYRCPDCNQRWVLKRIKDVTA